MLQVLDFGKAQWDKFTKKNLPGVLPGGMYTGNYKGGRSGRRVIGLKILH